MSVFREFNKIESKFSTTFSKMTMGVRWDSTCSLRSMYKDSIFLLQKYGKKYTFLDSHMYRSEKRIQDEMRYIKNIIAYHRQRIHESKVELILRNDRMFLIQ